MLFLDELPEFKRRVLEALRWPLQDGQVAIASALSSPADPAPFALAAAMNPCPYGPILPRKVDAGPAELAFLVPRYACRTFANRLRKDRRERRREETQESRSSGMQERTWRHLPNVGPGRVVDVKADPSFQRVTTLRRVPSTIS